MQTQIISPLKTQGQTALIPVAAASFGVSAADYDIPMTDAEFQRLDELETLINGNWLEIALDCKEIRESKLYRTTRDGKKQTWEEYCKQFHGQSKQYMDKTIRAAEVVLLLKTETKVSVLPGSIAQAAPLSGLKADEMAIATEAAFKVAESENRPVKADDFKTAAENVKSQRPNGNRKPPLSSARPEVTPQATAESESDAEATGSVGLHINNVSLVAPIRKALEEFGLQPQSYSTVKGTVFTFEGSAAGEQHLLDSLAKHLGANGPVDLRLTLE